MPDKYLVDVNLPKYFSFFNRPNFFFVADLDLSMSDESIWEYALKNQMVILTKDTDFHAKSIVSADKPKVVLFKLGNMLLKDLHDYFVANWNIIEKLLGTNNLLVAYPDEIEAQV